MPVLRNQTLPALTLAELRNTVTREQIEAASRDDVIKYIRQYNRSKPPDKLAASGPLPELRDSLLELLPQAPLAAPAQPALNEPLTLEQLKVSLPADKIANTDRTKILKLGQSKTSAKPSRRSTTDRILKKRPILQWRSHHQW
ncbi:hypothetical protein M427DRAFT_157886 [Gonapodya prolifera JEL478]|uniref:Uncharacterized protein n=1 Tax=Gonapodya prolifera (strain JEL478) TaxID=1344416 RepID=A0A139A5P1_GONPJ|nr:hypothetical protein M427DRAFT_157886 [Gonapodya prolifera JEL478]|eukprot:KXS11795.1 hypothetical protein M427DRAFT_157886 [Gonapodya prolifera JEL478]